MSVAAAQTRSISASLQQASAQLRPSRTAALDAQLLLAELLGVGRATLFAHGERILEPLQSARYQAWLARRAAGEPIAYIFGRAAFYDMELRVSPDVLIPRPETELLLERALQSAQQRELAAIADIGTGSGALAIALARHCRGSRIYATDICSRALEIARSNAMQHRATVHFMQGDLAAPLCARGIVVDMLVANLPYIPSADLAQLAVAQHEPRLALDGGADGLRYLRQLLRQLPAVCAPGAQIFLEIGAQQGAATAQLVRLHCGVEPRVLRDYAALDRIVAFQL